MVSLSKSKWLEGLTAVLFPRRCPVCHGIVVPQNNLIHSQCFSKISFIKSPVCKKCGKSLRLETDEYCFDCMKHKRSFDYGLALADYDDITRQSIVKIKYKNKREYLDFYGEAICQRFSSQILRMQADFLAPVPIHPERLKTRGFNQAQVLAEKLGPRLGLPVYGELLIRSKKTQPQKNLNSQERFKNLKEAFFSAQLPEGKKRVILVDDIYTTGSTIEACTRKLKEAGASNVYFIVIAIGKGK